MVVSRYAHVQYQKSFNPVQAFGKSAGTPRRLHHPSQRQPTRAVFGGGKADKVSGRQTIVPDPSFAIPSVLGGLAAGSLLAGGRVLPLLEGLLAAFLAFQASRVRFRFEADALEVVIGEKESKSENRFVGGENRWKYDTFTNWEFWWPNFPVLVYFKETQTKPEGQIHFFPVLFNGKQVYDVMVERCGRSQNSAPSDR